MKHALDEYLYKFFVEKKPLKLLNFFEFHQIVVKIDYFNIYCMIT
jgi:hypothetical protein